ncbi:hypothetical protein LWI28_018484 [Acer negundo]|uniref:O-methyltransferase dimerisation domain-containing protein n=1 Tax=Acer negundo TaxID=4023 RepID=A0AAD5NV08_ACENE|nr:hypothetical protein LWI28_018484 [Acer negundo]
MAPSVETQPEPNTQQEEEEAYYSYANNLAMSVVLPMALRTAVELDVFDIIAKVGPGAKLSASEIATQYPPQIQMHPTCSTGSLGFWPATEYLIVPLILAGKGCTVFLVCQNTL